MRIGEVLVEAKVIDAERLRAALARTAATGQRLGEALVAAGACTEEQIADALAGHLGLPRATAQDLNALDRAIARQVPERFARQHVLAALRVDPDEQLVVAVADPADRDPLDELRFLTGYALRVRVATAGEVGRALQQLYGEAEGERLAHLEARVAHLEAEVQALRAALVEQG